ncbi:Ribosomal RNA-processing protein 8 [Giardia muris]|uniref:Ribosomal RNA-processing protein 8 n=1 Tax=Giardia muris TaxID=5742 RepID=A0A4Z1T1S3_GIAMU|nr:Ribosomal RNA-processing protein 8 [Giardia muris]|eukprot:TNJ27883.1 Ribosomal RNA-processing protein 8 [Giardia muris]
MPINYKPIHTSGKRKSITDRLVGSRFRVINEEFYTTPSYKMEAKLLKDPQLFLIYHEGYQEQRKRWNLNPVDVFLAITANMYQDVPEAKAMLKRVLNRAKPLRDIKLATATRLKTVSRIGDMGCGDATFARELEGLPIMVRNFDLVSTNDRVEACNILKTPLTDGELDVGLYCLSLMGVDHLQFLKEAFRVIRVGGELWIAEVASRVTPAFTQLVTQLGFELIQKLEFSHFICFTFRRLQEPNAGKRGGREAQPAASLEGGLRPCLYKRR